MNETTTSIRQRPFAGPADLADMAALACAFPTENLHVVDLPYRLSSWALDDPENVGLWVDGTGQLRAWAVMQTPFWRIDYAYHPDAGSDLHRRILAWAEGRARHLAGSPGGHPAWFVSALAHHADRIRDLEEAGYACQADVGEDSWSKVLMSRPAQAPLPPCPLPEGFVLRPLAGEAEVEAYVELHRAAFDSNNMTVEWRARTLRRPEYAADLDLVAASADGRLAAFCVCWLHSVSDAAVGQIEPLGVHPEFRGLGLGRAILGEGLRRLRRHGVDRMQVQTDNYRDAALKLYESMGFRTVHHVLMLRRDVAAP